MSTAPRFKPLLAEKADLAAIRYPVLASPKLDGIRAVTGFGDIVSRNLKPIPNRFIREVARAFPNYLDGEILTYSNGVRDDFNTVQSKVMSAEGAPDFVFHVFDYFGDAEKAFEDRYGDLEEDHDEEWWRFPCGEKLYNHIQIVPHTRIYDAAELLEYETNCLAAGYEGVMIRDPQGRYKYGRSTVKEGILLKVKRFEDDEAVIIGTVERMHNANEAETDALGYTKRSTAKAGLVPMGTLGALACEWCNPAGQSITFEIGTGFDDATRARLWSQRESLIGREVNFKYQGVGSQGAPRFPVYRGLRGDK